MRRVLALLMLLSLSVLTACGENPAGVGRYVCVELYSGELPLTAPESTLLLDKSGYARLELADQTGSAVWALTGDALRLTVGEEDYEGTLQDGVIRLSLQEGLTLVFAREDLADAYLAGQRAARSRLRALQGDWEGDWYGLWRVTDAEGSLAESWYDCCARIRSQPDGRLTMRLWDEDSSAEKPLSYLTLLPEDGGTARAADGWFWLEAVREGETLLRLEDGCLRFEGVHRSGGERFSYSFTLRRWGESWDGEETPYYYESWYLPLIRSGESLPDRMAISK